MMTWEQEKAYCARRAKALAEQMVEAIRVCDTAKFSDLYATSMRYMKQSERKRYMEMFMAHYIV